MSDHRERLCTTVREHGYLCLEEPIQLRSGEWSRHFIDGKKALAHGAHLRLACQALLDTVAGEGIAFDAIGGLTLGADQFAHGVALLGDRSWFVVRKEPKGRGTNRLIEGAELGPSVRVLLVDDVITTGGSIRQALAAVREAGAPVVGAVALVDRGEAAGPLFAQEGIPYLPLLTYRDLGIPAVGHE